MIENEGQHRHSFTLKPKFGTLTVSSTPSEAEVFLAGEKVGETPYTNEYLLSGVYLLSVRKSMYLPVENQRIEIKDEGSHQQSFTLEANFGEVRIESVPIGAKIEVIRLDSQALK
ncbi:PEGA domain-containing protein [Deltaproteobacteria bacterium TL4]